MEEFFQSLKENWWDTSKALQYLYSVEICGGIGPTRNDEERESCHHGTSESCQEQKHADEIILEEKVNDYESLHECTDEECLNKYMLSLSSGASSLNSVSHSPCDTTRAMLEYSPRRSPSALEEAAREFTENTYQEEYASARPLSDSSAKLQADSDEMSSNEEGLLSKENHPDTETVAVKDSLEQRDQEFKQRRQPNCICARHQSNDIVAKQLQVKIEDLLHKLDQLQAENIFYVDRCLKQEEEITRLKENLTQIEEEKQGLESEVGRQLFLEDKNKRQSKLYQPFTEHCHEQIMPNAASGPYFHVTGLDGEQLDKAGPCNNSDIYKADSSSGRCGFASSCSQSSSSSAVNVQSLTKDLHSAEIIYGLNPDHPALKTWKNSGESASDTTSGGEEKEERSMPLLLTNECFESEEEEQGCASKEEGGKEGSVDLVPQQVGEPVVLGVDNAFLTRHSVDKPLCGSLYYNYAEMLAEDMDSMMNVIDSNQAKPYLGDCQAAAMSDPYYQPYSSAFPLPSEAYIGEDGFPLDYTFNGNSVLPPGPSSSHVGASMSQNGHLTSLQRSDFHQSGFTSSGLTSDFLGTTGPQMTHPVFGTQSNIGFTGSTSILPPEPLQMQTPSTTNVGLLERYNEMPTTCNVDSLDSTHNSPQAFVQGVRDARMRISAQFRGWWCTCSAQYDQDASLAVCTTCHKYRYLGQPRVQSCHDECCICHMDLSSGLLILPCSHRSVLFGLYNTIYYIARLALVYFSTKVIVLQGVV